MDRTHLMETRKWVKDELTRSADFWLTFGMDQEHGGIYTCLDRKGEVFSTDKSVWMQGRCAWTYAYLCNVYGKREEWLEASRSCLDFMEKHCFNREAPGRMYFTVTGDGKPLRQRRYCFSEGFYTLANAEFYAATGDTVRLGRARSTYELIYKLNKSLISDPAGFGPKTDPETRSMRALADPMIFLNITSVMRRCDPENTPLYDKRAAECADTIIRFHHKPDLKCTLESVGMNGDFLADVSAGRIVNPGHDIECSWFLLQEANYRKDPELHRLAVQVFDYAVNSGWDKEYGGILYFVDCLGKPSEMCEQDMKLWWPLNEMLIASLMIYRDTGDETYLSWFDKAVAYCKEYFSDPEYGEWYGYLRRDGKPTQPSSKGTTFKGPFHVPRSLIMVDTMLGEILDRQN